MTDIRCLFCFLADEPAQEDLKLHATCRKRTQNFFSVATFDLPMINCVPAQLTDEGLNVIA